MVYSVQARGTLKRDRRGWDAGDIREVAADIAAQASALRTLFAIDLYDFE
jgi:hypothetical protein